MEGIVRVVRKVTPAQLKSQLRQAQQKQRQAISKHNSAVRKYNRDAKRAVENYNREIRSHNTRVRSNRQRLERELRRLQSRSSGTTRLVVYRRSVVTLQQSFDRIDVAADSGSRVADDELLDLSEGETANSVAVLNALLDESGEEESGDRDVAVLQSTTLTDQLVQISPDLNARWHGALYALSPRNPDAARHFCTSAREILASILESEAPDAVVLEANPSVPTTPDGRVTRRARVQFCLERRGIVADNFTAFVEDDLDNVVTLFQEFNDGTHGSAGRFNLAQLGAIKKRVEDAICFLYRVVR